MRRALHAVLLAGCALVCPRLAAAQSPDTVTDERVWFTLQLQEPGSPDSPWRWTFETVVRSRSGVSELDVVTLRPTVIYAFDRHSSIGGGYAYSTNFPPGGGTTIEQRAYGQYIFTNGLAGGIVAYRARMEARFIEGNSDTVGRLRQQARYTRPISRGSRFAWSAYDELLLHLNETTRSVAGVDQNRIYGGVQVTMPPRVRAEAGYLNQFYPGHRGVADRMNHILSAVLTVNF